MPRLSHAARQQALAARGRRVFAAGLLLLTASAWAVADPCDPYRAHAPGSTPEVWDAGSFLLAVQGEGIPPSFLLGTFHSADPRVRERWDPVTLLLATGGIRVLFTERAEDPPLGDANDPRLLPAGESLEAQMGRLGLGGRFAAEAARFGALSAVFDRFRPWVAAALMEQGPAQSFPENGRIPDEVLRHQAQEQGVPVRALETLDSLAAQQDRVLGPEDQRALLAEAVCNTDASAQVLAAQTDAYAANNPHDFYRAMARFGAADPALKARVMAGLVTARNGRFWQRMAPDLSKGGVLAAVGNLHLLGDGGLAPRLAAAGFTLTALDPERLRMSLDAEQVPALTDWVRHWLAREADVPEADFRGVRIEPQSVVSLRRLRCPGQRCRIDGTYVADEQRILLEMGIFAHLLAGGAAPLAEFRDGALVLSHRRAPKAADNGTAYAESILVRELTRHGLHRAAVAEAPPSGEGSMDHCRENRILHRASVAQVAYLRHRGASVRAHLFPLDVRCIQ